MNISKAVLSATLLILVFYIHSSKEYSVQTCSHCPPGDLCCNDLNSNGGRPTCYNRSTHQCNNGNRLCPIGHLSCGRACYNQFQYACVNGRLVNNCVPGACGALSCDPLTGQCFDSSVILGDVIWARQDPSRNASGIEEVALDVSRIKVASDNTSYVCGSVTGDHVPFGDIVVYGRNDTRSAFVLALDPDGREKFVIVVNATGGAACLGLTLVSDGFYFSGSIFGNLTGEFASLFPDSSSTHVGSDRTSRGFFVKVNTNGTVVEDSLELLGSAEGIDSNADVTAISSDQYDTLYIVGNFVNNIIIGSQMFVSSGQNSSYFTKYSPDVGTFSDTQLFEGTEIAYVGDIVTNSKGGY